MESLLKLELVNCSGEAVHLLFYSCLMRSGRGEIENRGDPARDCPDPIELSRKSPKIPRFPLGGFTEENPEHFSSAVTLKSGYRERGAWGRGGFCEEVDGVALLDGFSKQRGYVFGKRCSWKRMREVTIGAEATGGQGGLLGGWFQRTRKRYKAGSEFTQGRGRGHGQRIIGEGDLGKVIGSI